MELPFHQLKFTLMCILCALLVYPILVPLLIIAAIYRQLVKLVVKISDSKCGSILTGADAWLAAHGPYKTPAVVLCPYFTLTSKLDRDHIIKVLTEQVVKPDFYPELRQRIVRRLGYYFWYPVQNFSVEDHVHYLNPECPDKPVTRTKLRLLGYTKLGGMPFDPSKSPWELILVPNLVDKNNPTVKSAVFLRVNHCLMDGYSMVHFLQKIALKPWKLHLGQQAWSQKTSQFDKFLKQLALLLKLICTGPYYALSIAYSTIDSNEFLAKALTPSSEPSSSSQYPVFKENDPNRFDGITLKKVRDIHGVSVSSLLITLVAEGVMKFIKMKCATGFSQIPKKIILLMSIPLPGHPDKMTNYWSFVKIPITVNKNHDPLKTLKSIHKQYERIKNSVVPLVGYVILEVLGLLPIWAYLPLDNLPVQTISLGNMPGPAEKVDMFGYEWEAFNLSGKQAVGSAFLTPCHTMLGKFWIDFGVTSNLVQTQQEVIALENFTHETLHQLEMIVPDKPEAGFL